MWWTSMVRPHTRHLVCTIMTRTNDLTFRWTKIWITSCWNEASKCHTQGSLKYVTLYEITVSVKKTAISLTYDKFIQQQKYCDEMQMINCKQNISTLLYRVDDQLFTYNIRMTILTDTSLFSTDVGSWEGKQWPGSFPDRTRGGCERYQQEFPEGNFLVQSCQSSE